MEYLDLGSLVILGAMVSLFTQIVKKHGGINGTWTMVYVLLLSFVSGSAYVLIRDTSYFETIMQIFISAGAVYTFVIKKFDKK